MRKNAIITQEQSDLAKKMLSNGHTYKEICQELNLSWGLVKNHLNRAKCYSLNMKSIIIDCLNCGIKVKRSDLIDGRIIWRTKFCSQSCSATYSNKNGNRKKTHKKKCQNCHELCKHKDSIFCSHKCLHTFNNEKLIERIKNKDTEGVSDRQIKRILIFLHGEKCMKCGWCERNQKTGKVPIEMNHIDGNSKNNKIDNLELVCPNCHSLTVNYKALNRGKGRKNRIF